MRYSKAAYTSKPTVITISNAIIRSGFLRSREAAQQAGFFKNRQAACHRLLAFIARQEVWRGSPTLVKFGGGQDHATLRSDERRMGSAR